MIKAASRTALGEPLLFLGLSGENVTRLAAGEPVLITSSQLAELGLPPMVIAIHYGRTEDDIVAEIKAHGVKMRPVPEAGDGA
jgi:hypothetical protein